MINIYTILHYFLCPLRSILLVLAMRWGWREPTGLRSQKWQPSTGIQLRNLRVGIGKLHLGFVSGVTESDKMIQNDCPGSVLEQGKPLCEVCEGLVGEGAACLGVVHNLNALREEQGWEGKEGCKTTM